MEINRLRHFCTVVETGHLRAAADLMRMSPGALSKSLGVFRQEIGQDLFTLSGKRLIVTEYGQKVYRQSHNILRELEHLNSLKEKTNSVQAPLKIATYEVFSTHFLSDVLVSEDFGRSIQCYELTPGKIEDGVESRLVDVGLTYCPVPRESLEHLPIIDFEFGLFGNKKWKHVPLADLPFAVPTTHVPTLSTQVRGLDAWPISVPRKISFELEALETALLLAAKGQSVLHCPQFVAAAFNKITLDRYQLTQLTQLENLGKKVKQKAFLVKRRESQEGPEMKRLSRQLRLLLRKMA